KALEDSEQRIEIFSQIKVILNEMDHDERIEVIEMMWGVILADGVIDDFEANLMRRMNGLLYVSGVESAAAKEKAMIQFK
ncbi:TerB family tellurite resistance protein, partial [bacterium]|nr:TerB family tellurite resistance protein [bacterium]